jgi:hypothetical protein
MQTPSWVSPGVWGAVIGAVGVAVFGFSQLGWVTKKTSTDMAQDRADTAVTAALVPFCVAKAKADPDRAGFLKVQAETSEYSRADAILKAGWATLGAAKSPDNSVARGCAEAIIVKS